MDNKQIRYLHRMLDRLAKGETLSPQNVESLRELLPELPIQKTLEEIAWDMDSAWAETSGNDWKAEMFGDLETWLSELHAQLRAHLEGVKSEAHPALPAGMRIAEHENFGRVVVSPGVGIDRCHEIFYLDPGMSSGTDISEVEPDSLTFIDSEPAKPAHPEFLETAEDYRLAPRDTIVAIAGSHPWIKMNNGMWKTTDFDGMTINLNMSICSRRVLRWGMGDV